MRISPCFRLPFYMRGKVDLGEASRWRQAPQKQRPACGRALQKTGAGERSRTLDLRITNALLYQLSYTGEKKRGL